jgi:histidinol-phosphate aminotransferase
LDFNENTVGCSPRVLQRLRELNAAQLACYPEREPAERLLADRLAVSAQELLLTNGVDEAIHLLCETYLEPGDEVLIVVPTFSLYEIYAGATGAKVISIPSGQDFSFPTRDVLEHINSQTRLIAVANPNNPTGTAVSRQDLLEIAGSAPDAALLVDEAYFEFHGETLLGQWRELPNLFVARTFSKAYGMAGLRIGVLSGDSDQMKMVRRVSSPYNVNGVALACLPEALADQAYVRQYVEEVCQGRDLLEGELGNWDIPYWPSRANFVLARLRALNADFIARMRQRGILVRDRSHDYGCGGCVRITLGTLEQTGRLLSSLRQVLEEIGVKQARTV